MKKLAFALCLLAAGAPAQAVFITSSSDASLAGGTVENFSSFPIGTYPVLVSGNVTLTPSGGDGGMYVENTFAGGFNATGNYLANRETGFTTLTLNFASPVSAFGFNWGASNESWILSAFDASSNLIESHSVPESQFSNAGDFYGIAASGIARATLTQTSFNFQTSDYVIIDNLTYALGGDSAIPEPATWALLICGFAAVGASLRRRRMGLARAAA